MANETLSIRKDQARLTVIGKSKADTYIDSGLGLDLGDLDIGSLDPFDLNWEIDVQDPDDLPDQIVIVSPPYKTEYYYGEKIDFEGIVVKAYKNFEVWTSDRYPDGTIPFDEILPSQRAVQSVPEPGVNYTIRSNFTTKRKLPGDLYLYWDPNPIGDNCFLGFLTGGDAQSDERISELISSVVYLTNYRGGPYNYLVVFAHIETDYIPSSAFKDFVECRLILVDEQESYFGYSGRLVTAKTEWSSNYFENRYASYFSYVPASEEPPTKNPTIIPITLYWQRPSDHEILSTNFDIHASRDIRV